MSNLSKPLREKLKEQCYITAPSVARKQVSKLDGTVKYLWQLLDGNCIETVVMQYHHGKHRLCFLAGGLPDGVRFLRVYNRRQGERLNTI